MHSCAVWTSRATLVPFQGKFPYFAAMPEIPVRTQLEEASRRQRIVVAGGLVVQHYVVGTWHAHKVIASRHRQKQQQIVGRVLVGGSVICVADIATHRQAQ